MNFDKMLSLMGNTMFELIALVVLKRAWRISALFQINTWSFVIDIYFGIRKCGFNCIIDKSIRSSIVKVDVIVLSKPWLLIFALLQVRCNIAQHNLAILIYLMRMIQSLASNQTISLERCVSSHYGSFDLSLRSVEKICSHSKVMCVVHFQPAKERVCVHLWEF